MNLSSIRSDVMSGLTSASPGNDFSIPTPLLDFWIISSAMSIWFERSRVLRSIPSWPSWAFMRMSRTPVALQEPVKIGKRMLMDYQMEIGAEPMPDSYGSTIKIITCSGADVGQVLPGNVSSAGASRYSGGILFYSEGGRILLHSGGRPLENCAMTILMIPQRVPESMYEETCWPDMPVPIPAEHVRALILYVIQVAQAWMSGSMTEFRRNGVLDAIELMKNVGTGQANNGGVAGGQ